MSLESESGPPTVLASSMAPSTDGSAPVVPPVWVVRGAGPGVGPARRDLVITGVPPVLSRVGEPATEGALVVGEERPRGG